MTSKVVPDVNSFEGKQSHSIRQNRQERELELLRQRGLTTLLNRYFTEVARQVALEKATTDAAQKDLERRRARAVSHRTKRNVEAEYSQIDSMCLRVNQLQKETRRKERETLLLYQRYVSTYGSKAAQNEVVKSVVKDGNSVSVPKDSQQKRKKLLKCLRDYRYKMEKATGRTIQYDQTLTRATAREATCFSISEVNQQSDLGNNATGRLNDDMCGEKIPELMDELLKRCINLDSLARVQNREHPLSSNINEHEQICTKEQQLGKKIPSGNSLSACQTFFIEDNLSSICSGITLNSEQTRQVLHECEDTVAKFLLREHMEVQKLMKAEKNDQPDMSMISFNDESTVVSTRAADQAEMIVKKMKSILNEFEISGNRESNDDDFREIVSTKSCRRVETNNPEEEWFAYFDDYHQRDYFHERKTNRTQWAHPIACSQPSCTDANVLFDLDEVITKRQKPRIISHYTVYQKKLHRIRKRRRHCLGVGVFCLCFLIGLLQYRQLRWLLFENSTIQVDSIDESHNLVSVHIDDVEGDDRQQGLHKNVSVQSNDSLGQCIDLLEIFSLDEIISVESEDVSEQIRNATQPWFRRFLSNFVTDYHSSDFSETKYDLERFVESLME